MEFEKYMGTIGEDIKQSQFKSNEQKVGINIMYTANWLHKRIAIMLKPHGLTPEQYNVLRILRGQNGEAASVKLVNERMLDPMSNVSRLVDKLLASALVDRKVCTTDRRQVDIFITTKGLKTLLEADKALEKMYSLFKELDEEQLEILNSLLDKIRTEH